MNHSKTLTMALIAISISMAACGGASPPATSTGAATPSISTSTSPAVEMINGIVVPPDPGSAKDATLAGVDTDNNGIRDEIDRWIATKYGDKPGALDAIRMGVRVNQKLLVANPVTQEQALSVSYESFDVGICIYKKLDKEGVSSGNFFNEELIRTFNTRERIDANKRVSALAGMIVRSVDDTTIVCPYTR